MKSRTFMMFTLIKESLLSPNQASGMHKDPGILKHIWTRKSMF